MARHVERLTTKRIAALKPGRRYSDGNRLYLNVVEGRHGISRSWEYIYRSPTHERVRSMGAGSYPEVDLAEARTFAQKWGRVIRDGLDPIDERDRIQAERRIEAQTIEGEVIELPTGVTVRDFAIRGWVDKAGTQHPSYADIHVKTLKNPRHREQWGKQLETHCMPIIGDLPLNAIGTEEVLRVLGPIWTTLYPTAAAIRAKMEAIFGAATIQGLRDGQNPWQLKGHLEHLAQFKNHRHDTEHHAALPWAELPTLMERLKNRPEMSAKALMFSLFTVLRSAETLALQWDFVSNGLLTVPGHLMKGGRPNDDPFVIPLSKQAQALLAQLPRNGSPWVFPGIKGGGQRPLAPNIMNVLLARLGYQNVTVHGSVRSGFKDWTAEATQFEGFVSEMAMHHAIPGSVEKAYRRGALLVKRSELMQQWADFLDPITP